MAFINEDTDEEIEEEDELDNDFLSLYSGTGKTIRSINQTFRRDEDEDEDEEDIFVSERLAERDILRQLERLMKTQGRPPMRTFQKAVEEPIKESREARVFQRHAKKKSGDMEPRKRLTYYLAPEQAQALKLWAKSRRKRRRCIVMSAINKLMSSKKLSTTKPDPSKFKERSFMFDEVPASLWDQIESFCHDIDGVRVRTHYEVVEEALRRAGVLNTV